MRLSHWIKLAPVFFRSIRKFPLSHLLYLAKQFRNENPRLHEGRLYVNTFFPPYPSGAFERFVETAAALKRVPYSTYFAVTDKCPYICPHCSYGKHQAGRLETGQALKAIEEIKSIGTITLGFTGGEPLLRDDLPELISATGKGISTVLFTTGFGLTEQKAKDLKTAGLDSIMIGMESDNESEQDRIRGAKGSYTDALKALKSSQKANLYTAISTVASKEKLAKGTMVKMAELAEKMNVKEFRILEPIPTGNLYAINDKLLTEEETKQLANFQKKWNRKNKGLSVSAFSYLESKEMFGCGAGFHHLFVDALGNVCPCDLTPLSFGNLLKKPLRDIWRDMENYFNQPHSHCLMKDICRELPKDENSQLPLNPEKSKEIMNQISISEDVPKIYKNLFKDRKQSDLPLSRQ